MNKKKFGINVFFLTALLTLLTFYTGNNGSQAANNVAYALSTKCQSPASTTAKFDVNKATALIVMDDGWESQYSIAYPILEKYGLPGNIAVISSMVGQSNYMSQKQLKTLYNRAGWDLLNHTETHPDLTTLSQSNQAQEIMGATSWLNSNCFTRGAKILVYPYGAYNNTTLSILIGNNFLSARSLIEEVPPQKTYPKYEVPVQILSDALDFQVTKKYIDNAIASKGTAVFVLHRFSLGSKSMNDSMFYTKQHLQNLVQYLYSNRSQIEVLTYSQWLQKVN